jgi:cell division protein FtsB
MKFQKEKKLKFFIPAVFAILILLIAVFSVEGVIKVYKLKAAKSKLADKLIYLKKDNAKIRRQIYDLKHNKQYISELARQELGMIKKGEIVFKFFNSNKNKKNENKKNKN